MIVVLGDLIVDIGMRIPKFPVEAGDIHRLSYLEIGPGGATNIAIMAARFGLPVACLGEVGDDAFGDIVINALNQERIDTSQVIITYGSQTPAAGVLIDRQADPAYLGSPGSLEMAEFPEEWTSTIQSAQALFSDGWAEHPGVPNIITKAFQLAKDAGVPIFFDPGPGNPDVEDVWVQSCLALATVLFVNLAEAEKLTAEKGIEKVGKMLLSQGPEMVVLKQGDQGCTIFTNAEKVSAAGYPVEVKDMTGAGDSAAGAVIYGYLNKMSLSDIAQLLNLTGGAKVRKLGTGLNMPTLEEIRQMMREFEVDLSHLLPQ